ncbi:peptide-methionine (S)-S-oxide reductase [Mycobacterium tuberculosis]
MWSPRGWATAAGTSPTQPTVTGTHAEAVEIIFDPTVTDYRTLLEFFFQIHDPTTKDRQVTTETSYRSAIFYFDEQQKRIALDTIADVEARPVARQGGDRGQPGRGFWEAEPEHQDYLQRYPAGTRATSSGPAGGYPDGPPNLHCGPAFHPNSGPERGPELAVSVGASPPDRHPSG